MKPYSVEFSASAARDMKQIDRQVARRITGATVTFARTGPDDYTLYWVDPDGKSNIAHRDSNLQQAMYLWATSWRELELPERCSQCTHRQYGKCSLTNKQTQDWDHCGNFKQIDWPWIMESDELARKYL